MTQLVLRAVRERREATKEKWAQGVLTGASMEATLQLNSESIGAAQELKWFLELDEDDLIGDENAEQIGPEASGPSSAGAVI